MSEYIGYSYLPILFHSALKSYWFLQVLESETLLRVSKMAILVIKEPGYCQDLQIILVGTADHLLIFGDLPMTIKLGAG